MLLHAEESKTRRPMWWLVALLVLGALLRLALLNGYEPLEQPDTLTYVWAAEDLLQGGDFPKSHGRRTPGYPAFMAALGLDPVNIMSAQMALGLVTSALLFFVALRMTRRPGVAFAAGLSYDLCLQQLFTETVLLTESITTFLLAAMVVALLAAMHRLRHGGGAVLQVLAAGTLGTAAILVRPQFIYLPLVLPLIVIYAASGLRRPTGRALGHAALVVLPIVLSLFAWQKVVQDKTGYFVMSNQSGFVLANHSVEFIELAPEKYATVRDIMLKYRAERIAASGHTGNTIWYAWPAIQKATGWSFPEASRQLQAMSKQMFMEHPLLYAKGVVRPWFEFWTVPILWELDKLRAPWLAQPLEWAWWLEHKLLRLSNLLFVLLVAAVVVSRPAREALRWDLDASAISVLVLCSSFLQAMVDRGAGSRYAVTFQALVFVLVLVSLVRLRAGARTGRRETSAAGPKPLAGA